MPFDSDHLNATKAVWVVPARILKLITRKGDELAVPGGLIYRLCGNADAAWTGLTLYTLANPVPLAVNLLQVPFAFDICGIDKCIVFEFRCLFSLLISTLPCHSFSCSQSFVNSLSSTPTAASRTGSVC